jgi:5'-3' exonuclease
MAYLEMTIFKKKITLMSTDKDFLHLVNERIAVWSPTKSKMYDELAVKEEFGVIPQNLLTWRTLDGDKSDNITGIRGAGLKTVKKCFPEIVEDKLFTVKDLIDTYSNVEYKYKLQENVIKNINVVKRNYLLMQLYDVDIENRKKLMLQNSFDSNSESLVKFDFQKMFIQDKLWGSIPNLDTWMIEFVRLNNYLKKETK